MSNLIKGLLEYSQIGSDRRVSKVDCNILLQKVLQDLNSSISEHEAKIRINNLPTLQGYKVELRQLFQNLISNAIKFHKPGEKPLVGVPRSLCPAARRTVKRCSHCDTDHLRLQQRPGTGRGAA